MAQSFSLAKMVPQAAKHNGGAWANSMEDATRKYAGRASGNGYVITGPVHSPSIRESEGVGAGQVRVPKYLFKLVYDQEKNGPGRTGTYSGLNLLAIMYASFYQIEPTMDVGADFSAEYSAALDLLKK